MKFVAMMATVNYKPVNTFFSRVLTVMNNFEACTSTEWTDFKMLKGNMFRITLLFSQRAPPKEKFIIRQVHTLQK